jgi:hypothetical protein
MPLYPPHILQYLIRGTKPGISIGKPETNLLSYDAIRKFVIYVSHAVGLFLVVVENPLILQLITVKKNKLREKCLSSVI